MTGTIVTEKGTLPDVSRISQVNDASGLSPTGRRNCYRDPDEDALVMTRSPGPAAP